MAKNLAKNPKVMLQVVASKKVVQILVALLFLAMGVTGFASEKGLGNQISRELSNMFGGDTELLLYIVSGIQLFCGVFLVGQLFGKGIPAKFVKLSLTGILGFWVIMIVLLDVLSTDFTSLSGSEWFAWIEQTVLHLIVLASIVQIQE